MMLSKFSVILRVFIVFLLSVKVSLTHAEEAIFTDTARVSSEPFVKLYYAKNLLYKKEFKEAEKILANLYLDYSTHELAPDILFWKGRAYFLQGEHQKSLQTMADFLKSWPEYPRKIEVLIWIAESVAITRPKADTCNFLDKLFLTVENPPENFKSRLDFIEARLGCGSNFQPTSLHELSAQIKLDAQFNLESELQYDFSSQKNLCSEEDYRRAELDRNEYIPDEAYLFGKHIQNLLEKKDLIGIFSLVKDELKIGPRKSFVAQKSFDEIFPKAWVQQILVDRPDCAPVGWRGFMLDSGKIWYNKSDDGWFITSIYGANSEDVTDTQVGWKYENIILHPQCFSRPWLSGDNYEEFADRYNINYSELIKIPGQFIGGKINEFKPIKPSWCSQNSECETIDIVKHIKSCVPQEFDYKIIDNSISTKNEFGLSIDYKILGEISPKYCSELAPDIGVQCEQSYLVEVSENTGGSFGSYITYGIYGVFELSKLNSTVVPLVYFDSLNESMQYLDNISSTSELSVAQNQKPNIKIKSVVNSGIQATINGYVLVDSEIAEILVDGNITNFDDSGNFTAELYIPVGGKNVEIIVADNNGQISSTLVVIERNVNLSTVSISFDELNPIAKPAKSNNNALALIIGVSDYENTPAKAIYADTDAMVFHDYASEKLGIPDNRIKTLVNDGADIRQFLLSTKNWLSRSVKQEQTDVYVFFAGHGLASDDGQNMYLLPYDGSPELLDKTAILRDELFSDIASSNPRSVTVFLDTCYSGSNRGSEMLIADARPILLKAKDASVPEGFTVFTAAAGDETAKSLEEAKHGMFSYFLMKGMEGDADSNGDKQITAGELHAYVKSNVVQQSSGTQTPELQGDADRVLVRFQ